jgi:hypothetical protein
MTFCKSVEKVSGKLITGIHIWKPKLFQPTAKKMPFTINKRCCYYPSNDEIRSVSAMLRCH